MMKRISLMIMFFVFIISGCISEPTEMPPIEQKPLEGMKATFFDVGQGDATLFQTEDATILIDAGRHDRNEVVSLLESAGVGKIDLFIGTHPHADHIGQADKVLQAFEVEEVWMSGDVHTTQTFERTIAAISAADVDYYEPRAGEKFDIGSVAIEVLNPTELTGDFHDGSIALRLQFGEISFLIMGDVEKDKEREILERDHLLEATILRLGHHGSSTSTSMEFLDVVNPEVAIYSAGIDNKYGHPHQEVVSLIESREIALYGTDRNGHIVVTTNGETYELVTEYDKEVSILPFLTFNKAIVRRMMSPANQPIYSNGIEKRRFADIKLEGIAYPDGMVLQ